MKIQCPCGSRYSFDVTPDMGENPVKFVCPNCGLDSSNLVNEMIRQELAAGTPVAGTTASAIPAAPASPPEAAPRLKISRTQTSAEPSVEQPPTAQFCSKHREPAAERCAICGKPICPRCMELFGYFCSPLCKGKAEAQNIDVPVYAGRGDVVEKNLWRKVGLIFGGVTAVLAVLVGVWFWYSWFGSVPHPVFSIRFDTVAYAGKSKLAGDHQVVFLHGGTLARYDLKTKKEIWTQELISKQQVHDGMQKISDMIAKKRLNSSPENRPFIPPDKVEAMVRSGLEEELSLEVSGQNVWVARPDKLTHYDWDSGKILQEIPLHDDSGELLTGDNELLLLKETRVGAQFITHINLASGESRTEEFHEPGVTLASAAREPRQSNAATGGLPLSPGADSNHPLDPQKVAQQAQGLGAAQRIALPATLGNEIHQEQIQSELKDNDSPKARPNPPQNKVVEHFSLIPGKNGYLQVAVRMLESRMVTRGAMKAPPAKSALDNPNFGTANEGAAINEQLNELQRMRGGETVTEDESLYQVTLRRPDSSDAADWSGQVVGPPEVHSLKTMNVLTAGKTMIVFDKSNKKLWQATLTYNVGAGGDEVSDDGLSYGEGPCVERGETLYVFDQAVLTAFDSASGNVRWRIPSVGVMGLFFDDKNMLYVNTTTANPDTLKYSRQIDISQQIDARFLKIDPASGRILWSIKPGEPICFVSGPYIYAVQSHQLSDDEQHTADLAGITPNPSSMWIWRISPKDGRVLWEHYQARAPLNLRFDRNQIEIVFRKEVQVLKYLTF